jgi:hypothetical protein
MRREVCLGVLLLSLVALSGCDTDQPLEIVAQDAQLSFLGPGAQVDQFNTWIVTEDSDNDGVADDVDGDGVTGDESLWCELRPDVGSPSSVPWTYSLRIRLLRAGQTDAVTITSLDAASDTFNRLGYDELESTHFASNPSQIVVTHARGACSGNGAIVCNPDGDSDLCARLGEGTCQAQGGDVQRTFRFSSTRRRILTAANRELLRADGNFIYDACSGDADCEDAVETSLGGQPLVPPLGNCPGDDFGDPAVDPGTVDGNPDPAVFGIDLNKGDTLIIEAVLSDEVPGSNQVIEFDFEPRLRSVLEIDGAALQAGDVIGDISSGENGPGAFVSFSYTSR